MRALSCHGEHPSQHMHQKLPPIVEWDTLSHLASHTWYYIILVGTVIAQMWALSVSNKSFAALIKPVTLRIDINVQHISRWCTSPEPLVCGHCSLQEEDPPRIYTLLCGSVTLLHGSQNDPELQGHLRAARTACAAEEAFAAQDGHELPTTQASGLLAAETEDHRLHALEASTGSTCHKADGSVHCCTHTTDSRSSEGAAGLLQGQPQTSASRHHSCSSAATPSDQARPGVWQRVMAAIIQGARLQLQADFKAASNSAINASPSSDVFAQVQLTTRISTKRAPVGHNASPDVTAALEAHVPSSSPEGNLTVSAVQPGHSFWWVVTLAQQQHY